MSAPSSTVKDLDKPTTPSGGKDTDNFPNKEQAYDTDIPAAGDILSTDEITGIKLALIIFGLCFSNILTGLVNIVECSLTGFC